MVERNGNAKEKIMNVTNCFNKKCQYFNVLCDKNCMIGNTKLYPDGHRLCGNFCHETNHCPDCGNGIDGVDELCDKHYKEYLGQHRGARED